MKRILSTFTFVLLIGSLGLAQEISPKRNFSYVEMGGAGLFFSLNYERQLSQEPGFSWRVGLGGYVEYDFYVTYTTGFAYLFALNDDQTSFIDLGANFTIAREYMGIAEESRNADIFESVVPGLSYRKHYQNDMILKAGVNAVINSYGLTPWFNIGFGKRF